MGKTEAILCALGHRFDDGPLAPAIVVQPTAKLAKSFADDRLRKLLHTTPSLYAKLEKGQRDRIAEKFISGCRLGLAWAGSATELASHACGHAYVDEVDRMDTDVGGEGDPITLVKARGKNYSRFKLALTSTPTIDSASAIQAHFEEGSREFFEWQCPHCTEWFRPQSPQLKWDNEAALDVVELETRLQCPVCDQTIENAHKQALNATGRYWCYQITQDGEYVPSADQTRGPHRSFWISGLCSPWASFGTIARELAAAYRSHDQERIQAVTNTYAGEVWRTRGDAPEWHTVADLAQPYAKGTVPPGVQASVMGVDVQKDCLYYVVRGFGHNLESWLLESGQLYGDTEFDDVWVLLGQRILSGTRTIPIHRCFIDSGYKPGGDGWRRPDHQVYRFCRQHYGHAYPTKGHDDLDRPIKASKIDVTLQGVTHKGGLDLWHLNTDYLKSTLYARIRWPQDAQSGGFHVYQDIEEDYCRQVVAEECVTKSTGKRVWIARRSKPNHYLDAEVNAWAAAFSLDLQSLPDKAVEAPAQARKREPSSHFQRRSL